MTYIRPNTGPTSIYPQTMPLGPTPPETQELERRPDGDSASISAQPGVTSLADLAAKARAAQGAGTAPETQTSPETASVLETKPKAEPPSVTSPPPKPTVPPQAKSLAQTPLKPATLRPPLSIPVPQTQLAQAQPQAQSSSAEQHQQAVEDKKAVNENVAKQTADWVGFADAGKEGAKFVASDLPDLVHTPPSMINRVFTRLPSLSSGLSRLTNSGLVQGLGRVLSSPAVKPVVKGLGRIAPFAGALVTGFDIYRTTKDLQDPEASTARKALSVAKSVASVVSSAAGVAALFLAPTGVGAAVAGAVALGAGLLAFGLDIAVENMD